jgi:dolichyl-phosphate-mannose-protein mannosyltransferase
MSQPNPSETQAGDPAPACKHRRWTIAAAILLLALTVRLPFLSAPGFIGDQLQFLMWSSMSQSTGLDSVYSPRPDGSGKYWCNYPPGYVYVLRGLAGAYRSISGQDLDQSVIRGFIARDDSRTTRLAAAIYKLPAVAADAALGILLFLFLASRTGQTWATLVAALYVLMPAVIHNSAIWGQIDTLPTLLVVVSLEMARRRQIVWMIAFAAIAILVKPQALMMSPVWLAVLLCGTGANARRLQAVAVGAAIIVAAMLPVRGGLPGVWASYAGAAKYYPFTHLNGFSVWFLGDPLLEPHLGEPFAGTAVPQESLSDWYARDDVPIALGITPRACGLLAVAAVGLCAFIILCRRRCDERSLHWAARLLPLAFFILPTQMHERYLFPAIALWAWSACRSWRWLASCLLIGLCASINALWVWSGPPTAAWAAWCTQLLHRPWLGVAPGIWCSVLLSCLLVLTLLEPLRPLKEAD